MRNQLEKLIEAAKDYKEYQSIGNGAKLNCAIEAAELALQQPDLKEVARLILLQVDHNRECGKDDKFTLEEIADIIDRRVVK